MAESAAVGLLVFRPYFTAGTERAADEAVYAAHRLHSQQPQRTRARFRLRRAGQEQPVRRCVEAAAYLFQHGDAGYGAPAHDVAQMARAHVAELGGGLVGELLAAEDLQSVVGEIV